MASGSASEEWVCGLIAQLQDKLDHRIGENIMLPLDLVAHVQSALISGLRAWADQDRLDWLSRKRSPGTVHLTFNGATSTSRFPSPPSLLRTSRSEAASTRRSPPPDAYRRH